LHQYLHHIGDFRGGTYNMTRLQRAIYRELIDVYYDKECPLPLNVEAVYSEIGAVDQAERGIVDWLLRFKFIKTEGGYVHDVCERNIAEYRSKADVARENGKKGGRPRKVGGNQEKPAGFSWDSKTNPDQTGSQTNRKPLTVNLKPKDSGTSNAVTPNAKIALGDDGAWTGIPDALMATWKQAYPALSLDAELSKAAAWIIANPKNKKSNYARFLTNWLTRAQDHAPRTHSGQAAQQPRNGKFDAVAFVNRNRPTENHERTDDVIDV
jgi:uncharacterized protein YdaU (DUF1376 family)